MEHIKLHDWCSSEPDVYFLNEADIDNSVTEKILRNKFRDPLISSDSEDDGQPKIKINWDEIFNKKKNDKSHRLVVPGMHPVPPFPKLSGLSIQQHFQCLKVLCAEQPHILPSEFVPRPTKQDRKVFEELKETYAKEQQEFIEWAKTLWTSNHCVRALRPKPPIEMVYEAEFKMAAHKLQSFPKNYAVAAQIPLETANAACEIVHEKDLINVTVTSLPKIQVPDMSERVFIMNPYPTPEPCSKHPTRFQLPGETDMTILPLTEVHKELAQFAVDSGAQYIAGEEALRCLMQLDEQWMLPVSVCEVIGLDGACSCVVLEAPAPRAREPAPVRARAAFRRLLHHALAAPVEASEKRKRKEDSTNSPGKRAASQREPESSDDDDTPLLYIDTDTIDENKNEDSHNNTSPKKIKRNKSISEDTSKNQNSTAENEAKIDFYNCTCRDSFDKPPPRSYKKWKVVNWTTKDKYSMIVHCPHRTRGGAGEVVLEACPEYQLDVGARRASAHAHRAHALALTLRKNATVLNVRIDGPSGEIVTSETVTLDDLLKENANAAGDVTNRLFTALDQLQGLRPGHYLLQHEPSHGNNAILYSASPTASALTLQASGEAPAESDEAAALRAPAPLAPALLPVHKFRKILPCAFTPFPGQVAKEPKKPVTRQKTPPQAIKWPKKKNRKRKKKNNNNNNFNSEI